MNKRNKPMENKQSPAEHLKNVTDLATKFSNVFKFDAWGKIAGENHDIGKGLNEWQAWLRRVNDVEDSFSKYYADHVNHAIHGAKRGI